MYTPPPQNEKVGFQVKVTFCFRLMYPPLGMKSWIQVKVTFWFWLMYPLPEIEIGLNMNAIGKKSFKRGHQVHFTNLPPLPLPLSDSMPEQETGEFQFQMDIWTRTPFTTLLQPKK